jgi:hypothetical protein
MPVDASVDVTEAHNARLTHLINGRHLPVDAYVYQLGLGQLDRLKAVGYD